MERFYGPRRGDGCGPCEKAASLGGRDDGLGGVLGPEKAFDFP